MMLRGHKDAEREAWRLDVVAIEDEAMALAQPATPVGALDVERLARACAVALQTQSNVTVDYRKVAERIAAAYLAAASEPAAGEPADHEHRWVSDDSEPPRYCDFCGLAAAAQSGDGEQ
jgi:hypothetical protein